MALSGRVEDDSNIESVIDRTVINLLLVDLGNPANIGSIIRSCHTLGGVDVGLFIYDPRDNLTTWAEDIHRASLGLSQKPGVFIKVTNLADFLSKYPGRKIKTDITPDATPLPNFRFMKRDLIMLGNENRGYLTKELVVQPGTDNVKESLIIPMLGEPYEVPSSGSIRLENTGLYANLNVGTTASIVTYFALSQLGKFNQFRLGI